MSGKKEYRYNIISTDNPIQIKIPVDINGNKIKRRNKLTLEIESFHWMGSFYKEAVGSGVVADDVQNVPPHFFFFMGGTGIAISGTRNADYTSSNVIDYAYPKSVYDVYPTTTPPLERAGGTTIDDYGGISYKFLKVAYGIQENVNEKIDISNVSQENVEIEICSQYSYISGAGNTLTTAGRFKFFERSIQGMGTGKVSEPYILRVLIVDE